MRYRQGRHGSRPGMRVEVLWRKGVMHMDVWNLLAFVLKVLPDVIKLAKLIANKVKNKRRPKQQRQSGV